MLSSVAEGQIVQLDRYEIVNRNYITPLSRVSTSVVKQVCGVRLLMTRWAISVVVNTAVSPDISEESGAAVARLPLDVMNNYFSLGADAHVTLEFHESRGICFSAKSRAIID